MQLIHSCRGDLPAHDEVSENYYVNQILVNKTKLPFKGSFYLLTDAYMSVKSRGHLISDLCYGGGLAGLHAIPRLVNAAKTQAVPSIQLQLTT